MNKGMEILSSKREYAIESFQQGYKNIEFNIWYKNFTLGTEWNLIEKEFINGADEVFKFLNVLIDLDDLKKKKVIKMKEKKIIEKFSSKREYSINSHLDKKEMIKFTIFYSLNLNVKTFWYSINKEFNNYQDALNYVSVLIELDNHNQQFFLED